MLSEHERSFAPAYQQSINQPDFVQENTIVYDRAAIEPAPSFLTQTPLGAPHEGMDGRRTNTVPSRQKRDESLDVNDAPYVENKMGAQEKRMGIGEFIYRWANGEFNLSMSKVSIMSLVFGLLFIGFLFFVIGFLAAVATLSSSQPHDSQSAWQDSNASGIRRGGGSSKLGSMATGAVGAYAKQELAPLTKAVGGATAIVPKPLQPFARYGVAQARSGAAGAAQQVNPFARQSRRRERAPDMVQQPYGAPQPASGMPQPYPTQYAQPYGAPSGYPPAPQGGYRPPMPAPQGVPMGMGGYPQGYVPAPQQPMAMPQSPYPPNSVPQPMGVMPSQPIVYPQQAMPPQMMQPPAYPQQPMMPSQGGYYQ